MTEPHQDSPSDPQLSRFYREYATDEPSSAADERILAAARAALAEPPANARRGAWWQRWRTPLALATTLLLTIPLALLQERQPGGLPAEPSLQQEAAPARSAAPSHGVREQTGSAAAPEPARPAAPSPQPGETRARLARPSVSAGESDRPSKSDIVAEPGLAAAPPGKSLSAAVPAAPAVLDSAPSPAATIGDSQAARRIDSAPAAGRAASPALAKTENGRSASVWLDEIRALRREGKTREAERQLQEFRRANPDYPLPEDFRQ